MAIEYGTTCPFPIDAAFTLTAIPFIDPFQRTGITPSFENPPTLPVNSRIPLNVSFGQPRLEGVHLVGGPPFSFDDEPLPGPYTMHVAAPGGQILSSGGFDQCVDNSHLTIPLPLDVQYATTGKKSITATQFFCDPLTGAPTTEVAGQITLTFQAGGGKQFQISANVPAGATGPVQAIAVPDGGGQISAGQPYKLGQRFTLEYDAIDPQTAQPVKIPATMTFQSQQPANMGKLSDIFSDPTRLFPDNVLLHFTDPVPDEFFSIHSGKAVIDIKPNDPSSGAPEVFLTINVPSCPLGQACNVALGTTYNQLADGTDLDSDIVRFADFRGIPPQILKGQIQRESNFDANAYRYEPLTVDFAQVFPDPLFISKFPAFSPYVLGPSPSCPSDFQLPQSAGLQNDSGDVNSRDHFQVEISRTTGQLLCAVPLATPLPDTREITPQDVGVTMENILFTNNRCDQIVGCVSQNWTRTLGGGRELELFESFRLIGGKPFAAQTVVASSYGLIQVLYTTAVQERRFFQNGFGRHPSDMFVPKIAIDLGTEQVASLFQNKPVVSSLAVDPEFQGYDDLKAKFGIALVYYNGRPRGFNPSVSPLTSYASDVLQFSDSYKRRITMRKYPAVLLVGFTSLILPETSRCQQNSCGLELQLQNLAPARILTLDKKLKDAEGNLLPINIVCLRADFDGSGQFAFIVAGYGVPVASTIRVFHEVDGQLKVVADQAPELAFLRRL